MGVTGSAAAQRPMRADARRNHERLLAVAKVAFAARGAEASLDDIARQAGVGAGTLYRHFPTREALLEAVYREEVEILCREADRLGGDQDPAQALAAWLRALVRYVATKRGLSTALKAMVGTDSAVFAVCHEAITRHGGALLEGAQRAGAVRADLSLSDLLRLASAIGTATEQAPHDEGLAERLLGLMMDGWRDTPSPGTPSPGSV
jgi:AcrR family transcriptional regulator